MITHVFSKCGVPECMIMEQDSALMSTLIDYLFKNLGIEIKTIALYNHQSFKQNIKISIQLPYSQNISQD